MKTRSAKAKGRRLQDWLKKRLIELLGLPKDTDYIRTAVMGEGGADVQIIGDFKLQFPYAIECKNQEKYKGVYDILDQAALHSTFLEPLGVIKMNGKPPLIVLNAEHFLEVYFGRD
tara:strand:- start:144 stop:491 length:348 start_codon:yes stop_codon:yes gene_type:complete